MRRFWLVTASALALATGGASVSLAHDAPGDQHGYNMSSQGDRMRFAQQELQELGYYHGKVDGVAGPDTKRALQGYQKDNHLRVTAALDQKTFEKLGGKPAGGDASNSAAESSGSSGVPRVSNQSSYSAGAGGQGGVQSGQTSPDKAVRTASPGSSYSPGPNPGASIGDRSNADGESTSAHSHKY